jgi:hypothetical protein
VQTFLCEHEVKVAGVFTCIQMSSVGNSGAVIDLFINSYKRQEVIAKLTRLHDEGLVSEQALRELSASMDAEQLTRAYQRLKKQSFGCYVQ